MQDSEIFILTKIVFMEAHLINNAWEAIIDILMQVPCRK